MIFLPFQPIERDRNYTGRATKTAVGRTKNLLLEGLMNNRLHSVPFYFNNDYCTEVSAGLA